MSLTRLETLIDGMKTQCNDFVANHQPARDSHSTWKERAALLVNRYIFKRGDMRHTVIYT